MFGDQLIGPHVFQSPFTSATYLDFLEHHLPELFDVISKLKRAEIIYEHDGAPADSSNTVRDFLNLQYRRWSKLGGQILGHLDHLI